MVEQYDDTTRTSVGNGFINDEGEITVNMLLVNQTKTDYRFKLSADKNRLVGRRSIGTMKGSDQMLYTPISLQKIK